MKAKNQMDFGFLAQSNTVANKQQVANPDKKMGSFAWENSFGGGEGFAQLSLNMDCVIDEESSNNPSFSKSGNNSTSKSGNNSLSKSGSASNTSNNMNQKKDSLKSCHTIHSSQLPNSNGSEQQRCNTIKKGFKMPSGS